MSENRQMKATPVGQRHFVLSFELPDESAALDLGTQIAEKSRGRVSVRDEDGVTIALVEPRVGQIIRSH
jgi:hypothetical protein